jgi:hypothetical protein
MSLTERLVLRLAYRIGAMLGECVAFGLAGPALNRPVPGCLVFVALSGVTGVVVGAAVAHGYDLGEIADAFFGLLALFILLAPVWILAVGLLAGIFGCLAGRR